MLGKDPFTDLLGDHGFEGISHPWFTSPAPGWGQGTARFIRHPAKFSDPSAPRWQHLSFEVYLGTFMKEQSLPRAFGMVGACVHMDQAAQEGWPRVFTGGRGKQEP